MSTISFFLSIISFFLAFKLACNKHGIQEGATLWFLNLFMKRPADAALSVRTALKSKSHKRQKEG